MPQSRVGWFLQKAKPADSAAEWGFWIGVSGVEMPPLPPEVFSAAKGTQ